jgi:hypothetical protein
LLKNASLGTKCQGTTSVVPQKPQKSAGLQPLRESFFKLTLYRPKAPCFRDEPIFAAPEAQSLLAPRFSRGPQETIFVS